MLQILKCSKCGQLYHPSHNGCYCEEGEITNLGRSASIKCGGLIKPAEVSIRELENQRGLKGIEKR